MEAPKCKVCGTRHWGSCLVFQKPEKLKPDKQASIVLPKHHRAWLNAHPERSESWLIDIVKEGFEIHHLDGNHDNDHHENLLLIEKSGHRSLHGWRINRIVHEAKAKFDRNAYQREYMRKRRAKLKA